ncbi:MAG: hypothetical protein BRD30_13160 [Bacteroidetes bacterium QH_2_63_10]|nr:MAG: hypothetical protein BRD30_13160 [Bacteroidetes bacterium QH_2_63_10]
MRAFLMRGAVLEVLESTLGKREEQPCARRFPIGKFSDDDFLCPGVSFGITVSLGDKITNRLKKTDENGATQGPCDFVRLIAGCSRSGD